MKKITVSVIAVLCCCLLSGCVTSSYTPTGPGKPTDTETPPSGTDNAFTVRLSVEGEPYVPQIEMAAQWYNGESIVSAAFADGVASAQGLDGDYNVTLSALPEGYTYNPNRNIATNRNKNVVIELLPLIGYIGSGADFGYDPIRLNNTGAYGVKFTEAGQSVCCNFIPPIRGTYIIESIMNAAANEINPRLEYYGQNTAGWTPPTPYEICRDGGVSSAYTRNFKYSVSIDNDCINFCLKCDSRLDYPVTLYFTIEYEEDYSRDPVYEMIVPQEIFDADGNVIRSPAASGRYIKCGMEEGNTNHILDASEFALGEDGYYHLKDGDSIVYADLSAFLGSTTQEGESGPVSVPVSLKFGLYDYTLFIKGWAGLVAIYGTSANVPEKYQDYKDTIGYVATVFEHNRCAVTEELRVFLQRYCVAKRLFNDGNGSAEHNGYNSSDADQWLYFCGYYI